MQQPAMSDYELDQLILQGVDQYGALSMTRAKELTKQPRQRIVKSFARLTLQDKIVWVAGLPRQGVFFTRIENGSDFGLPLLSKSGFSARGWTRKSTKVKVKALIEVLTGYAQMTIDDIAEELGWGRDTVRRHLARLEATGQVESVVIHDGERGRPPIGWALVKGNEDIVDVDFYHAHPEPPAHTRLRRRMAMRRHDRSRGGKAGHEAT